jgi:hypothetical protein
MNLKIVGALAALAAAAAESASAFQTHGGMWSGFGGPRSSLKPRHQTPPAYKQGARECARRRKQMGFTESDADDHE